MFSKKIRSAIFAAALAWFQPAFADAYDDANAAYNRGDYAAAFKGFISLAEKGHDRAQSNLGVMYSRGQGVSRDYKMAVKWYREAAKQGWAPAQYNLGVQYYNGEGVPQDHVQSHAWFNLAVSQSKVGTAGYDTALMWRDMTVMVMTPNQIAEAQLLAREWAAKYNK